MRIRFGFIAAIVLAFSLAAGASQPAYAQSAQQLFQRALDAERGSGRLTHAIALYDSVIKRAGADRALAARALLRMGNAYELLGRTEARAAYERVVRDFTDQPEIVGQARSRIAALGTGTAMQAGTGQLKVRSVWTGDGVDALGAPTRDGRFITYVDWETGDLAVRDLAREQNRRLTNKGPWDKSGAFALNSIPSPDGRGVAYAWFPDSGGAQLRLVGIDGGESRLLYSEEGLGYIEPHDWTPDGRHLLATAASNSDGSDGRVLLVSASTGTAQTVKSFGWAAPNNLAFSPDGRWIVYDAPGGGAAPQERDVFLMPSAGGTEERVIHHPAQDVVLGWMPDGRHLLFATDRTGNMSQWLLPISNGRSAGAPMLIRRDAELAVTPMGFTTDGSFYYASAVSPIDIHEVTMNPTSGHATGASRPVIRPYVAANRSPAFSNDGRSLAYLSQRRAGVPGRGGRQIVVRSLETGAERLVSTQLDRPWPPLWSPDDRFLVLAGTHRGTDGIYRLDPETGEATLLAPGGNRRLMGWLSDGESIAFVHQDFPKRTFTIYRRNTRTGVEVELLRLTSNLWTGAVAPDGRQIAFAFFKENSASIGILSENGGEARTLYTSPPEHYLGCCGALTWSADGRFVIFASSRKGNERTSLLRVSSGGGSPEEIGVVSDGEVQWLRAHPDGRRLVYNTSGERVEVRALENVRGAQARSAPPGRP